MKRSKSVFAVAAALAVAFGSAVAAAEKPAAAAAQQLWLIDTRCAPRCGDLESGLARIAYYRCDGGTWQPSDAAAFRASGDPAAPTVIAIHGNRTDPDWAVKFGSSIYAQLQQRAAGRPFRLVIWSWPSEQVARNRPDAQIKASWSDSDAYYLARTLPSIPPGGPVSLIGYSLGCRVISGALELLAGGCVAGQKLAPEHISAWNVAGGSSPRPIRLMFLAAAIDWDWLESCRHGGQVTSPVQRILVTQNCSDRVLRWFSRIYGRGGPEALGYVGPAGPDGGKLEVVDVACSVGREHDWRLYTTAPEVAGRLGWYTFLQE